jgi:hypothetical protein
MKQLDGRADAVVSAPLGACFSLLAGIELYPSWCGEFVREVTDIERDRDGYPRRAHVRVHVAQSPFAKDYAFDAVIRIEPPRAVHLSRLPGGPADLERLSLSWSLADDRRTRIGLEFSAGASFLPRLLPLPGVGDLIAGALLDAATRALGGSITPAAGAPSSGQ